jgi:hypothetical protein
MKTLSVSTFAVGCCETLLLGTDRDCGTGRAVRPIDAADAPGANHPSTSVTYKTVYVGVDGPVRNSVASRQ